MVVVVVVVVGRKGSSRVFCGGCQSDQYKRRGADQHTAPVGSSTS